MDSRRGLSRLYQQHQSDRVGFPPGGSRYDVTTAGGLNRSAAIAAGTADPVVGAALGSTVYNGSNSFRFENTTSGGYASVLSQTVNGYTDP